jgi:hypothetical protein
MNNSVLQELNPEELLQAYIAADKVRRENNGQWGPQWEISKRLNDLGYYVYYHHTDECNYSQYHLEKRQGYWGNGKKWDGDVIKEEWQ